MILGYVGKYLEVDLSKGTYKDVTYSDEILKDCVGGRALAARILFDRLGQQWEKIDPLNSRNILLFMTGPFTGFFPGGRICVSGKSPQSNGVVGSTVGGELGIELRCAGYDGIIVLGKAERPVFLFIKDSEVEIRDATRIWGKNGKETNTLLNTECRSLLAQRFPRCGEWKEPAKVYIGQAGENKVRTAVVMAKWTHAAGYGGYGAVMGSKKLKAIAVKGTGPLPEVSDLKKVERLINSVNKNAYENVLWRRWGTGGGGYSYGFKTSSEPIRNWQDEWHDEKSYGVDQFESRVWVKQSWSDFGCPTNCLKIAHVKSGKYKGSIADNPDYEFQAYLGTNLGIFTPEDNVFLASLTNDLGLCGIQTGNVMGFAAELYQRRILSKRDLDGIDLKWGNTDAFAKLTKKIAFREGIGDLLAEGTYRAALKISRMKRIDALQYAVQNKGIGIGAHGIRSGKDFSTSIGYACSVQCGDHTSHTDVPIDGPESEVWEVFNDSAVLCNFNSFGLPSNLKYDFYNAITGLNLTRKAWADGSGLKTLQIQRALLLLGGPDIHWNSSQHDDNPKRFYEPLPSGPYKGKAADRESVRKRVLKYYDEAGWDENGIPKTVVLKSLGLDDVDAALEKLRNRPVD